MENAATGPRQETLDEATCRSLVQTQAVGRIAYVWNGVIHIVPVNFVMTENRIVFRSDPGDKVDHVPLHSVCFETDEVAANSAWSVVVRGHARDVTTALNDEYERMRHQNVTTFAPLADPHWIAIDIERIEGRRITH